MKLVRTLSGGQPFGLNSIDLIQDNFKNLTSEIVKAFNIPQYDVVKVYGCEFSITDSGGTSPTVSMTSGSIYRNNEIFLVDSDSFDLNSGETLEDFYSTYEWDYVETTDTTVIFTDSTSNDIHKYRKGYLTTSPNNWSGIQANIFSLKDIMYNYSNINNTPVDYVSSASLNVIETVDNYYEMVSYDLADHQHIVKIKMDDNTTGSVTSLARINPPVNGFYDGYEIELRVKKGNIDYMNITDYNEPDFGNPTNGNIDVNTKFTYPETPKSYTGSRTETITIDSTDYDVEISEPVMRHSKIHSIRLLIDSNSLYLDRHNGLSYDVLPDGETLRVKFKYDMDNSLWYETARIRR